MKAPGAQCVMTPGAWQRQRWCVGSWAVDLPWRPSGRQRLALEMEASGWMRCGAEEVNHPYGTVQQHPGDRATASMRKMQA
jgi:hypothetical protein